MSSVMTSDSESSSKRMGESLVPRPERIIELIQEGLGISNLNDCIRHVTENISVLTKISERCPCPEANGQLKTVPPGRAS
jgi:hypothetical protein